MLSTLSAVLAPDQTYPATIRSVTDGDSLRVDVVIGTVTVSDLAADVVLRDFRCRLSGCNAAEVGTDAGKAARDNLRSVLTPGLPVSLHHVETYKYGLELVAAITMPDGSELIPALIEQQWLAAWDGKGTRPVPPWPRTA